MVTVSKAPQGGEKDKIFQAFEVFQKEAHSKDPSWICSLRKDALSRFQALGFPTLRDEEWKYTNVDPIVKNSFRFIFEPSQNGSAIHSIQPFLFGESNWDRLVFVNGLYVKDLSFHSGKVRGVKIESLGEALLSEPEAIQAGLARQANFEKNAFTALNTAFIHDGAFISLPKGTVLETPIHLIFVSTAAGEKIISQPRNLVIAGEGSRASVIESYVSLTEDSYFTNAVTEIFLDAGAGLEFYEIQRESEKAFHVATTEVVQGRDAHFSSHVFSFGAQISRNNLSLTLKAEGSESALDGLYVVTARRHSDHHTVIDHTRPHGTSRQLYKGILRDQARAVFNGKIFVRQDAQKTDAQQTNKNLLLSAGATVDTKPQLEIFADDVKCTHGAAVGELEEEMLFYVKSRGIGEENARRLLTYGFASELIERVKLGGVRLALEKLLWKALGTPVGTEGAVP